MKIFLRSIHLVETFTSNLSSKLLQQKLNPSFLRIELKEFSFEEISNPTIPEGMVIFEFGLADAKVFSYIDEEETKKALSLLAKRISIQLISSAAIRY